MRTSSNRFEGRERELDELPLFDDTVEETEMRENVENYPGDTDNENEPTDIFSSRKRHVYYSDLEGISRPYANFQNHHMPFVTINSSELRYANFEMANLVCASISHSKFPGANFKYADLEYSEIVKSDLSSADLSNANLRGSRLNECDFRWSDLRGADLSDCTVQATSFNEAIFDEHTQLPFSRQQAKKYGMVYISEKLNAG